MDKENQFKAALKQHGERISTPRLIIFRALLRHSPLSSTKLVALANKNGVDPATTYRNLRLLRQMEIVKDLVAGNQRLVELSDAYEKHHHHFWCRRCGQLTDFDSKLVESSLERTMADRGLAISSHHIEVTGLCGDCVAVK